MTTSAPGKLMLLGEHAVLYGQPCIVTAVSERMFVFVEKSENQGIEWQTETKDRRFLEAATAYVGKMWAVPMDHLRIQTKSTFSGISGFGSSSAVTVATLQAIASYAKKEISKQELFDAAYKIVLDVQGTGSGFDVAAAVYGGTVYFQNNGKVIEPITLETLPLVVGYTGEKGNTVELIEAVRKKREAYPERVDRIMQAIGEYVNQGKKALVEGDWERVGKIMNFTQEYLRDLGVSSEKLEALIQAAKQAGAFGAKLSGAGGGDCMIAIVPPERKEAVTRAIIAADGQHIDVTGNAQGVRIESTDSQDELFIVVDEKDTVIGYKTRYVCHHDKTLIHRAINILVYDNNGRLLLQKRSKTKDTNPGLWTLSTSGHVTKGETYEQAAARELQEELGVKAPKKFITKFLFAYKKETEMEAVFEAHTNGPFSPLKEEIDEIKWVSNNELPRKLLNQEIVLTESAYEILKRVKFL